MTDVLSPGGSEGDILDNLKINPDTIAISGFSSGGYFSTQFHVAFSKKVMNFKVDFFSEFPYIQGVPKKTLQCLNGHNSLNNGTRINISFR